MQRSIDVEAVVEELYELMRRGNARAAADLMSADLTVSIGTDEDEWWADHDTAAAALSAQIDATGALGVAAGSPRGYKEGKIGWFEDRALITLSDGQSMPVRVTGVVRQEDRRWRLLQVHVSVGTPNAEFGLDLLH